MSERLSYHAGNFFRDPLPAADVLIMGRVLHNWDLGGERMLLRKAHDALPSGGALIVYERLIDDARRTNAKALFSKSQHGPDDRRRVRLHGGRLRGLDAGSRLRGLPRNR